MTCFGIGGTMHNRFDLFWRKYLAEILIDLFSLFVTGLILLVIEGIVPVLDFLGLVAHICISRHSLSNDLWYCIIIFEYAIIITTIVTIVLIKLGFILLLIL